LECDNTLNRIHVNRKIALSAPPLLCDSFSVKTEPSNRELEIGKRLRAFREGKKITRTAFALSIGIGSERLASYESGRVPLRFEVFASINRLHFINPLWLAMGEGNPYRNAPFPLEGVAEAIPARATFSEAWASSLGEAWLDHARNAKALLDQFGEPWKALHAYLMANPAARNDAAIKKVIRERLGALQAEIAKILGSTEPSAAPKKSRNRERLVAK
jgi:transcriptional regulator with XRE-family HTH domain